MAIIGLLGACDAHADLAPGTRPSPAFLEWLAVQGRQFTPAAVPAGAVAPEAVMRTVRDDFEQWAADGRTDPPIYGIVSCATPTCDMAGWPGERVAIWLIGFPDTPLSDGGTAWTVYDAETGDHIMADGPRFRP
jgi:hypothetical protein